MRLLIDPGHTGQTDPGAVAEGVREADVVLDVGLRLRQKLVGVQGLEVRITRELSLDLVRPFSQASDLRARTDMANAWPADFFLSLHCNAASDPTAHGVETYTFTRPSTESVRVAQILHTKLKRLFDKDRGMKQANFWVLRETKMPACLVEMGFLTNDVDRSKLKDPAFRDKLAQALAEGVMEAWGLQRPVPSPTEATPILGPAQVTLDRAQEWAKSRNATPWFVDLAVVYWAVAPRRGGVRPEVAYAQAAKETGFGRFGGTIPGPEWHNPCGLKTRQGGPDSDPYAHARFPDDVVGVMAHVDHLALYAGAEGYPRPDTPDPRHFPVVCGRAKTVEALGGAWAPSKEYGLSLVRDYLTPLLSRG